MGIINDSQISSLYNVMGGGAILEMGWAWAGEHV